MEDIETTPGPALGRQLSLDYYDCDPVILTDVKLLEKAMIDAAKEAGATIISSHFHAFTPQGVSGVIIISESHFAVHTWPEHAYAAVDVFTCGDRINFEVAAEALRRNLHCQTIYIGDKYFRGLLGAEFLQAPGHGERIPDRDFPGAISWERRFEQTAAKAMNINLDLHDCTKDDALEAFINQMDLSCATVELRTPPDNCDQRLYLDIYLPEYRDPRLIAETACSCFGAQRYRLQVHLRY